MRASSLLVAVVLALATSAAIGVAAADDSVPSAVDRARQLDSRARAAFEAGDPRGAAEAFHAANELVPNTATKYNEARAWEAASELPRAAEAFEAALQTAGAGALDEQRASDATKRLEALRAKLGRLRIKGPEGARVSIGHLENTALPVSPFVASGDVKLQITFANGTSEERSATVGAGETLVIDVAAPAEAAPVSVGAETPPPDPGMHPATIAGAVLLSLGGASGIASAIFGVRTTEALDTYEASGYTDADARSATLTNKTVTNALLGTALATGAAGIVCLAVGLTSEPSATEPAVAFDFGLAGASLRGRF
ncbi:MAG: hypothetical protein HOV80_39730 [Polyangiaceae bacterium]|nr:hypothetical protein [Polyangiaceae bacterium]